MNIAGFLLLLIAMTSLTEVLGQEECTANQFCDPLDFFFGIGAPNSRKEVTWAHAVNSQQLLAEALASNVMMLEADISWVVVDSDPNTKIPIMAHPPATTSDLSFKQFLTDVLEHNKAGVNIKGIKLDFKTIGAVEPALSLMQTFTSQLTFPIMLNADVLQGPVNSTSTPVNATEFLRLSKKFFSNAILSLGWTTRMDCNTTGPYTQTHFNEMVELIRGFARNFPSERLTFPVRAGLIAESSEDDIAHFLIEFPKATFTIWGSLNDPVDLPNLRHFITAHRNKVYVDLPFDPDTTEHLTCSSAMQRPSMAALMLLMYSACRRYM